MEQVHDPSGPWRRVFIAAAPILLGVLLAGVAVYAAAFLMLAPMMQ
ncbi:hypothetical protein [Mycobacterium sp. PS03-16]|nr:hypothetical protein [Mycobacterium sp. PS03-16]